MLSTDCIDSANNALPTKPSPVSNFAQAVAAAEAAYAKTEDMLDAVLEYARFGVPVFPVLPKDKDPKAARLKDENGNPIPGTGGFKRATTDRAQLEEWWPRNPHGRTFSPALIGVPMGPLSGVWCCDVDTKEGGHSHEGFTAWKALQAEHGEIVTRQHKTNSGGLHEIFEYEDEHRVTNGRGKTPKGIDIKGDGGYICVPPSKSRKGNRAYDVVRDIAPVKAPSWLYELVGRAPDRRYLSSASKSRNSSKPSNPYQYAASWALVDIAKLNEAMPFVPNHEKCGWDNWTAIGLHLHAATGGSDEGFALWNEFSQRPLDPFVEYDEAYTRERWYSGFTDVSPPKQSPQSGANNIYRIALENGWRKTEPTHKAPDTITLSDARQVGATLIEGFLVRSANRNPFQQFYQLVQALRMDTGVGKTALAIKAIAKWLNDDQPGTVLVPGTERSPWSDVFGIELKRLTAVTAPPRKKPKLAHYVVPTRNLIAEIVERFAAEGINARAFYGRTAPDPDRLDDKPDRQMCLRPDVVDHATEAKLNISKSCCRKNKEDICPLYYECHYQRQGRDAEDVEVWVFAGDYLFIRNEVLGKPDVVFIDEGFWRRQLRELKKPIPLQSSLKIDQRITAIGAILARQPEDGGLQWKYASAVGTPQELRNLINEFREMMPEIPLHPGLSDSGFKEHLKRHGGDAKRRAYLHGVITVLTELRKMVKKGVVDVSGRLELKTIDGRRYISWRGIAPVRKQYRVPTLILDATMPDISILKVSHRDVEIIGDISVPYPDSVHVRQILDAPTTATKLIDGESAIGNGERVLRYIEQLYIEHGRQPTLVIAQKVYEERMAGRLPNNVSFLHFNNLAGVDAYGKVRLLIVVGRVAPGPMAAEDIASTLLGEMVPALDSGDGFTWYDRVPMGIRLKDGSGVAVMADQHPHPLAEAARYQITEAELLQAIGRGRPVNRTLESPLTIACLFDNVVPVSMDTVLDWERPSRFITTAMQGVMLTESPEHLTKIWPDVFANRSAADTAIKNGVPVLPGFVRHQYQLAGARQRWRKAQFDRTVSGDPVTFLEKHLGGPVRVRDAQ